MRAKAASTPPDAVAGYQRRTRNAVAERARLAQATTRAHETNLGHAGRLGERDERRPVAVRGDLP